MHEPLISVVTCCYNQGAFLAENIDAVLAQRYPRFEHIIVDDGSTDSTREVCARYAHVKYIYQENQGQSAALNTGFQAAGGAIIAWVNSDDGYLPGAFDYVAKTIDPVRGIHLLSGNAKVIGPNGNVRGTMEPGPTPFLRLLFHPQIYRMRGRVAMPPQPSVFFHRTVLDTCGLLDTSLTYAMDYDYWLRAMRAGFSFTYRNRFFSLYRFHATSHSNQGFDTFLPEWQAVSDRHFKALSPIRKCLALGWLAVERFRAGHYRMQQESISRINHHPVQVQASSGAAHEPDNNPLVSVILPVYNGGTFLRETVQSALDQTYTPLEILIVDDGSTDNTPTLLNELAEASQGIIRLLHHPNRANRGVAASRNLALRHTHGEYIAFLDADDLWEPDKIRLQVQQMAAQPDAGLCFTAATLRRDAYGALFMPRVEHFDSTCVHDTQSAFRQVLDGSLLCAFSSVLTQRACVEEAGGFEEGLPFQYEDRMLLAKIAAKHDVVMLDTRLTGYRIHTNNSTADVVKSGTAPLMFFDLQSRIIEWLSAQDNRPYARLIARRLLPGVWRPTVRLAVGSAEARPVLRRALRRLLTALPWHTLRLLGDAAHYLLIDRYRDRYRPPHELEWALESLIPELVRAGITHVWLYGAGQHTQRVLALTDFKPLTLRGIIDDHKKEEYINDIPLTPLRDCTFDKETAIIISSDTSQSQLYRQARAHGMQHIHRIY